MLQCKKSKLQSGVKIDCKCILVLGLVPIQLTFTCSNSTIETVEKRCEIRSKLTIETPE